MRAVFETGTQLGRDHFPFRVGNPTGPEASAGQAAGMYRDDLPLATLMELVWRVKTFKVEVTLQARSQGSEDWVPLTGLSGTFGSSITDERELACGPKWGWLGNEDEEANTEAGIEIAFCSGTFGSMMPVGYNLQIDGPPMVADTLPPGQDWRNFDFKLSPWLGCEIGPVGDGEGLSTRSITPDGGDRAGDAYFDFCGIRKDFSYYNLFDSASGPTLRFRGSVVVTPKSWHPYSKTSAGSPVDPIWGSMSGAQLITPIPTTMDSR